MLLNKFDNPLETCDLKFQQTAAPNAEDNGIFSGYASVFGGIDSFGDTIMKGAFAETLEDRKRPVKMFYGHSPGRVIGKWLDLREDDTGLLCQGELTPNNRDAMDVYASMKHGAIDGLSIGFRIPQGGAEEIEDGGRRISKVDLVEISVVSLPADDDSRVQTVKSIADEISSINSIRDAELFLREAGSFPRSMAKALIGQLREVYLRDADAERKQMEALRDGRQWVNELVDTLLKRR